MASKDAKKQERILMIVESPNKVKTLKQFLPNNYIVMASVGHITEIANGGLYNTGINLNGNFEADYKISDDKKEIVKGLKEQVSLADKIILASDPDREGELISYMLKKFLKVPESKYERVTYHEITQKAILEALEKPRKIDENMAISAMTRARLDKIVGYRLSPIARRGIGAKSVGRCQSAGLKLITDKETEIANFKSTKYFELYLNFLKSDKPFQAKYVGTDKIKIDKFDNKSDVDEIIKQCENHNYIVKDITSTDRSVSPKLPFTTSTFQQEVSSKLGISVKGAMGYAQKLFEGITIAGKHIALITYIRTDSTDFAPEFVDTLTDYIKHNYGEKYYAPIKKSKKGANVQDGHEAIRPVDLEMTPERLANFITDQNLLKVYTIIYNRTLASSMAPAIVTDTDYSIYNLSNKFVMTMHALKFDGFKKIYNYKEDNDEELSEYAALMLNEVLFDTSLQCIEKTTKPPRRYTEATLISTLDKLGIGRPSTYATIVGVLTDTLRGYCTIEDKSIVPTEKGMQLSDFLDKYFSGIINTKYTAELEGSLDLISSGELNDVEFLTKFYSKLKEDIKNIEPQDNTSDEVCPECGKPLVFRNGKFGRFLGCSGYPKCKYLKKV